MKNANQDLNRLQQPNVLPFSVGWTCYLGNPSPNQFPLGGHRHAAL